YSAQCYATANAVAEKLNISHPTVCFQSRLGRDPWLQPYTADILTQAAKKGHKRLLVFSPSFVSDCLETTIEIGTEYRDDFLALGGHTLDLVPSLNLQPAWIDCLRHVGSGLTFGHSTINN
ncbi:MAG: ferrochelatase, partial [Chlamydiia bacterium]|nr:ferrochelatase [Chlamydiia bacterium]